MEKRRPTYDLAAIQQEFDAPEKLRMTRTAANGAAALFDGDYPDEVFAVVQAAQTTDFVKSMTTYHDNTLWQDVYTVTHGGVTVYLKFQKDEDGHFIISFKEK